VPEQSAGLPRIALGCGNFGGIGSAPEFFGQGLDEAQADALMDAAWEAGITHFDTADGYGGGRSELAIGRWIAARGVRPTLTSKTFHPLIADGDWGLAPERVARSIEASLERLGVDRVELYLAHDCDPRVPMDAAMAGFEAQRLAGRTRAYGVSNVNRAELELALAGGRPAAVQNGHSLLDRRDADVPSEAVPSDATTSTDAVALIDLCAQRGVAYIAYSPLCGGWLTGKYRRDTAYPAGSRMTQRPEPYAALADERTFAALDALERFAGERGISMAGAALAWLLADARIAQIVVGPGRPEQLAPVTEALAHPLNPDERDALTGAFA
jgi:aryl-alcohol dehydrogenase-like predicted oxidoreductase